MNLVSYAKRFLVYRKENINERNRAKLQVKNAVIVASNCVGGCIYHWLGLEFESPFVNLYMTPADFVTALENFDDFMNSDIEEVYDYAGADGRPVGYPVGKSFGNTILHFMHYNSFEEAIYAWNRRKARMKRTLENGRWHYHTEEIGFMLSNYTGGGYDDALERFNRLPYTHKVVFTDCPVPQISSSFYIKGYRKRRLLSEARGRAYPLMRTQNYFTGKRFIDQFDYVEFINSLGE